ncbi:MAG: hypothetical protein GWP19_09750 [Planctomycetia bacterium]|nr:hypothetical protein [Planctomycetia bacterium]
MLKHIKTISETIRNKLFNIEIVYENTPVYEDFDYEIFFFKITDLNKKYFSYKVRIFGRVIASESYGLDSREKQMKLGLEKTFEFIAKEEMNDIILSFTDNGWLIEIPNNPLVKHSSYYKKFPHA